MANNSTLPATGDIIATEQITDTNLGAVKFQAVKLYYGAYGVSSGAVATANPLPVSQPATASAALTSVASSATSVSLLAANTSRKGASIANESTSTLYVAFAATASATAYSFRLNPYDTLVIDNLMLYTGAISGIWSSANGNARITELT